MKTSTIKTLLQTENVFIINDAPGLIRDTCFIYAKCVMEEMFNLEWNEQPDLSTWARSPTGYFMLMNRFGTKILIVREGNDPSWTENNDNFMVYSDTHPDVMVINWLMERDPQDVASMTDMLCHGHDTEIRIE